MGAQVSVIQTAGQEEELFALTIPKFCERLGLDPGSHWSIRKWIRQGRLKSFTLGSRRLIPGSELKRVMEQGL